MNAYELADKLNAFVNTDIWCPDKTLQQASIMIRQQADRIAELEHMNKNWSISEGLALQRIAELEKQLQESAMDCISAYAQADDHYARVKELEKDLEGCEYFLKAHPVKQLSNDKIREIGDELKLQNGGVLNWIDFARAIIKASRGEE